MDCALRLPWSAKSPNAALLRTELQESLNELRHVTTCGFLCGPPGWAARGAVPARGGTRRPSATLSAFRHRGRGWIVFLTSSLSKTPEPVRIKFGRRKSSSLRSYSLNSRSVFGPLKCWFKAQNSGRFWSRTSKHKTSMVHSRVKPRALREDSCWRFDETSVDDERQSWNLRRWHAELGWEVGVTLLTSSALPVRGRVKESCFLFRFEQVFLPLFLHSYRLLWLYWEKFIF